MALLAVLMTGALSFQMAFPLMLEPGERKIQKGGQSVGVAEEHQAHHRQEVFIAGVVGVGAQVVGGAPESFFNGFDVFELGHVGCGSRYVAVVSVRPRSSLRVSIANPLGRSDIGCTRQFMGACSLCLSTNSSWGVPCSILLKSLGNYSICLLEFNRFLQECSPRSLPTIVGCLCSVAGIYTVSSALWAACSCASRFIS